MRILDCFFSKINNIFSNYDTKFSNYETFSFNFDLSVSNDYINGITEIKYLKSVNNRQEK